MSGEQDQRRQSPWEMWRGNGLAGRLVRGSAGSLLTRVAEVLLGVLLLMLLARSLGADGLGVYAFVLALMSLLSVPTRMGLPTLVVRETARGQVTGEWGPVLGLWRWANAVAIGLSLLVALGLAMVLLADGMEDETFRNTLLWGLLLVPLLTLLGVRSAALRGLRHLIAGMVPGQVFRPGLAVILVAGAMLIPGVVLTPDLAMGLTVVATFLAFALGTAWLYRTRPAAMMWSTPKYDVNRWFAAAWPMALTQGFEQLNRYADVLLLGVLATSADVGVYRIAAHGALLVALGLTTLNMVVAPFMTQMHARGEFHKLQKMARRVSQAALTFAVSAVLVFAVFGEWLLVMLFGPEFGAAWLPLLILGLGQVAHAGFGPTGLLLNMTGHEREVALVGAVAASLNVMFNLALIPLFGVTGAALATSASLVTLSVWLWFVVRRRLGVRCSAV